MIPPAKKHLLASLHDVQWNNFTAAENFLRTLPEEKRKATALFIIPYYQNHALSNHPEFIKWLKEKAHIGHEIGLHGWTHQFSPPVKGEGLRGQLKYMVNRFLAGGQAEFCLLSKEEAKTLLLKGISEFVKIGVQATLYCPPAWYGPANSGLLRETGIPMAESRFWLVSNRGRIFVPPVSTFPRFPGLLTPMLKTMSAFSALRLALHPWDWHTSQNWDVLLQRHRWIRYGDVIFNP